jgi:hypothetical protein
MKGCAGATGRAQESLYKISRSALSIRACRAAQQQITAALIISAKP